MRSALVVWHPWRKDCGLENPSAVPIYRNKFKRSGDTDLSVNFVKQASEKSS